MENTIRFSDRQTLEAYYQQLLSVGAIMEVLVTEGRAGVFKDDMQEAIPYLRNLCQKIRLSQLSEEVINDTLTKNVNR